MRIRGQLQLGLKRAGAELGRDLVPGFLCWTTGTKALLAGNSRRSSVDVVPPGGLLGRDWRIRTVRSVGAPDGRRTGNAASPRMPAPFERQDNETLRTHEGPW